MTPPRFDRIWSRRAGHFSPRRRLAAALVVLLGTPFILAAGVMVWCVARLARLADRIETGPLEAAYRELARQYDLQDRRAGRERFPHCICAPGETTLLEQPDPNCVARRHRP